MMQGFIKLKQSMLDMKDKEIRTCKDTLAQLKEQVKELQTGQQQRQSQQVEESSEQIRAKVHSLAYIN